MSITDEEELEEYQNTVELVALENGENYLQFNLPWAFDPKTMPNNYAQAKNAALKLQRKLEDKPDLRAQYCKKIECAFSERHIVRIPEDDLREDLADSSKPQYYIPHFNTSQSKFRVVYNAARQYQGMSLNKLLNRGPIFLQSLRSMLTRFGEKKYGVAGDIANMFFQRRIAPRDQDMLRILWFSAPEMKGDVVAYKLKVAPYGLRCIPSMAGYSLAYTADKNMVKVSSDATKRVTRDMFVDDFITGVDTIEEGRRVIDEVLLLLSSTGFRLTKWNGSNRDILTGVAEKDLAPALRDISEMEHTGDKNRKQTTLGLIWNTETDELLLRKPDFNLNANQRLAKKQVVSLSHQVFDPLTWWAPFHVQMNLCCSKIVRQTPDWDEEISHELNKEWDKAVRELEGMDLASLPQRRIPLNVEDNSTYEYHMFADSSKDVAAAAVYLRVKTGECYTVHLVAAKTSVISATEMARGSMSRKETIALDIGARLLRECLDATTLPIDNFELWSDSRTVIQWCTEKSLAL